MCHKRFHNICYTVTTYEVHTLKQKKDKKKTLKDIFVYHFLFYICLFLAVELLK